MLINSSRFIIRFGIESQQKLGVEMLQPQYWHGGQKCLPSPLVGRRNRIEKLRFISRLFVLSASRVRVRNYNSLHWLGRSVENGVVQKD